MSNADVYQQVTDIVKAKLQEGVVPWRKPWSAISGRPRSMSTGTHYNGVNVLLLGLDAAEKGYTSPWWGTYSQIAERAGMVQRGGRQGTYWASADGEARGVRKGEHGTRIVLAKKVTVKEANPDTGQMERRQVPLLRFFTVFNAEQADGLPGKYFPQAGQPVDELQQPQEVIDHYLANGGPVLEHLPQDRAYYRRSIDTVRLPLKEQFPSSEAYYATAFHELTHSTNHKDRLNREPAQHENDPGRQWGDKIYAREELVAEMGSALLQAVTGIESDVQLDQSATYIEDWLGALDKDPQLVSHAASQASKAADLILDQRQAEREDQAETEPGDQPQRQAA